MRLRGSVAAGRGSGSLATTSVPYVRTKQFHWSGEEDVLRFEVNVGGFLR